MNNLSYSWTQPICGDCWSSQNPNRVPVMVENAEREQCAFCGLGTGLGIYTRVDPKTVTYPTITK